MLVLASTSSSSVSKKERATKLAGSDFQTTTLRLFPRKIRIARRRGKDNDGRPKPNARGRARRARVSRPRAQPMGTDGCRGTTTRAPPLSILRPGVSVAVFRGAFWILDFCTEARRVERRVSVFEKREEAKDRERRTSRGARKIFHDDGRIARFLLSLQRSILTLMVFLFM